MKTNINRFVIMFLALFLFAGNIMALSADESIPIEKDWYTAEISDGEYMTFESEDDYLFFMSKIDINVSTVSPCIPGSPGYPTCPPPTGEHSSTKIVETYTTASGSLGRSSITPKNTTARYITLKSSVTYSSKFTLTTKWGVSIELGASKKQGVDKTYANPSACGYLEARGTTKVTKYQISYYKNGSGVPYKVINSYGGLPTIQDYRFVSAPLSSCP